MSWALIPLTDEQLEIQRLAREFAQREIAPHSEAWDRDAVFDPAIIAQLGELGFLGMMIPEQYDGLGLDTRTYLVALEEIAAVDASIAVAMSVHNSLPTQMLLRWGTEAQKERYLKQMARGEKLGAFALSEPEAGSDAASLRTQAVRDGDCWVLNGTKAWVTSGSAENAVILAMARTDTRWVSFALRVAVLLLPAALVEELVFRGYPFAVLRDAWGWKVALVVTSIAFGVAHVDNPGADLEAIIAVIVAGVFLGSVLVATGSLFAAWMAHFSWNWMMAAVLHTAVSGLPFSAPDYRIIDAGPDWATGGRWGPEGGVGALVGMLVVLGFLYARWQRRAALTNHMISNDTVNQHHG